MLIIDNTTPLTKFIKLISNPALSHSAGSLISQFRITHVPINSYLKRCKKIDSSRCPTCGEENENITHFLLICPSYC